MCNICVSVMPGGKRARREQREADEDVRRIQHYERAGGQVSAHPRDREMPIPEDAEERAAMLREANRRRSQAQQELNTIHRQFMRQAILNSARRRS